MLVYLNQISFLFLDCIIFSKSVYHQYYLIPYKWRQWYILDLWAHLIVIKMQFCRLDIFFPFWSFNNYMIFLCGSLDQACFRRNITVVTIYASLGEEALCHSLNEVSLPLSLSNLVCSVMLSGCTLLGFFLYNLPEKNKLRQFGGRFRKRRTNILLTHLWVWACREGHMIC